MKTARGHWSAPRAGLLCAITLGAIAMAEADPSPGAHGQATPPAPIVVRQGTPIADDPPKASPRPAPASTSDLSPAAHRCFVRDVMATYDRTRVRCHNAAAGRFVYFAVDTSQPVAETLLVKAWTSMRSGKPMRLRYAPTPDLNPPQCSARDCRRLIDAAN